MVHEMETSHDVTCSGKALAWLSQGVATRRQSHMAVRSSATDASVPRTASISSRTSWHMTSCL